MKSTSVQMRKPICPAIEMITLSRGCAGGAQEEALVADASYTNTLTTYCNVISRVLAARLRRQASSNSLSTTLYALPTPVTTYNLLLATHYQLPTTHYLRRRTSRIFATSRVDVTTGSRPTSPQWPAPACRK